MEDERDVKAELREWEWVDETLKAYWELSLETYLEVCVSSGEVVINAIREEFSEYHPMPDFSGGKVWMTTILLDGLINHTASRDVEEIAAWNLRNYSAEDIEDQIATLRQFADALERGLPGVWAATHSVPPGQGGVPPAPKSLKNKG